MISLYGFGPMWGLPDFSHYVTKVDVYLRMAEIPYQMKMFSIFDLDKTPKGKLPMIDDGDQRIADSSFIIEHLIAKYGDRLDGHLTAQEKAVAHAMHRMADENLGWAVIQLRWRIEENCKAMMDELLAGQERAFIDQVTRQFRDMLMQYSWSQGIGRHSIDEVWHIANSDLAAISDYLGDKPFLMGDKPTSVDASVYAMIIHVETRFDSPTRQFIRSRPNLVAYCQRIKERYYAG